MACFSRSSRQLVQELRPHNGGLIEWPHEREVLVRQELVTWMIAAALALLLPLRAAARSIVSPRPRSGRGIG